MYFTCVQRSEELNPLKQSPHVKNKQERHFHTSTSIRSHQWHVGKVTTVGMFYYTTLTLVPLHQLVSLYLLDLSLQVYEGSLT